MPIIEWTVSIPHEDTGLPLIVDLDTRVRVELCDDGSLFFDKIEVRAAPGDDWSTIEMSSDRSLESALAFRVMGILEHDAEFVSRVKDRSRSVEPSRHVFPGGYTQGGHGTINHEQTGVSR